tara:strand:+ start:179 stop:967 length:789 start_codon:yes stop_codon:yes gene_type:complete
MNFTKLSKNTLLAAGLVTAMSSCNKDLKDEVATTKENTQTTADYLNQEAANESYGFSNSGTATAVLEGFNNSDDKAFDEKTITLNVTAESENTISEGISESSYYSEITGVDVDYTYTTQYFSVEILSDNGTSNAGEANQSSITVELTRVISVDGISDSQFEETHDDVNSIQLVDGSYDFTDNGDFEKWSASGSISSPVDTDNNETLDSYGFTVDNFDYNEDTHKISFVVESTNESDADKDLTLKITVDSEILATYDSAQRVK